MVNTEEKSYVVVIRGITKDGRKFRPSDWAERMSGMLSVFGGDHRIHYSPMLKPVSIDGVKCISLDPKLESINNLVFRQIIDFAERNDLEIVNTDRKELEEKLG